MFLYSRINDIYVGVDVFGRGCYGGGGFSCNEALQQIVVQRKSRQLSIAIFAPGWTHETKPKLDDGKNGSDTILQQKEAGCFSNRESKFWKLLENFLNLRGIILYTKEAEENSNPLFKATFHSGCGLTTNDFSGFNNVKNQQSLNWFLDLEMQDFLPPMYSYPITNLTNSKKLKDTDTKLDNAFHTYFSNDAFEFLNCSQLCEKEGNGKQQHIELEHFFVVKNNCSEGNWIFSNRISAVPLFLNEITSEKLILVFCVECKIFQTEESKRRGTKGKTGAWSSKPHLTVKYKQKQNNKTAKLCPYFYHYEDSRATKCCLHESSYNKMEHTIGSTLKNLCHKKQSSVDNDFDQIQYVFNLESLGLKIQKSVIISAILIEAPLLRQKLGIKNFVIYEV